MRIAVLDLGTNTFHLLIADVNGAETKNVFRSKIAVKLGEGAIQNNRIAPVPFRRGVQTLLHYKLKIDQYKPDRVFAFATSAIRSAENGLVFIRAVKKETGLQIKIITGEEEARLIYYGVRQCIRMDEPSLIMDIGGGSTEFIIADYKKIYWKRSFNIGAARLLGIFEPSDPIRRMEIKRVENYLEENLSELREAINKYPVKKLIGSSGSFDTYAEMLSFKRSNKGIIQRVKSLKFDLAEFGKLSEEIIQSTTKERFEMKGLIKMRVDMIVLAAIFTNYILKNLNMQEMYLSKYALKEGMLWKAVH